MYLDKSRYRTTVVCGLLAGLLFFVSALAVADTELIVRVDTQKETIESLALRLDFTVAETLDAPRNETFLVESDSPGIVLTALRAEPAVIHVEPNRDIVFSEDSPDIDSARAGLVIEDWLDDPETQAALADKTFVDHFGDQVWISYVHQRAAHRVRIEDAHYEYATGSGIVAVIDSGIDPTHPALQNRIVNGFDFVRNVPGIPSEWDDLDATTRTLLEQSSVSILDQSSVSILDQSSVSILDGDAAGALQAPQYAAFGHGTMVAGIVRLVAPNASIMPLKAFSADGTGRVSDIVRAIYYAIDNGASVINMSFSMRVDSPALDDAIDDAEDENIVCVSSVGNEGLELEDVYPAHDDDVAGVAATDDHDRRSVLSNFGNEIVRLAAPGEGIITAYPSGNYAAVWGTSFSAAFVSGAAALLRELDAGLDQEDATEALSFAVELQDPLGDGRLDLMQALAAFVDSESDGGEEDDDDSDDDNDE